MSVRLYLSKCPRKFIVNNFRNKRVFTSVLYYSNKNYALSEYNILYIIILFSLLIELIQKYAFNPNPAKHITGVKV